MREHRKAGKPEGEQDGHRAASRREDCEEELFWISLAQKDPSDFAFFYRKYFDVILGFIYNRVWNGELAQDLTQETFSIAIEKLGVFKWRGITLKAWLCKIAYNLVLRENDRAKKRPTVSLDCERWEPAQEAGADTEIFQSEEFKILHGCLATLSDTRRNVILSHYWTGLKVKEIAEVFDLSTANVKAHLRRGRDQLLQCVVTKGVDRGLPAGKSHLVRRWLADERGLKMYDGEKGPTEPLE